MTKIFIGNGSESVNELQFTTGSGGTEMIASMKGMHCGGNIDLITWEGKKVGHLKMDDVDAIISALKLAKKLWKK